MRSMLHVILFIGLLTSAGGCATSANGVLNPSAQSLFWPKRPDPARIRYVGEIGASSEWQPARTFGQGFRELVYGPADIPRMQTPHAVAVHESGNLVAVADTTAGRVFLIDLTANTISWWPETTKDDTQGAAALGVPTGVAFAGDTLFICDAKPAGLVMLARDGSSRRVADSALKRPAGIAYDSANERIYVVDSGTHEVVILNRSGALIGRFGGPGAGPGKLNFPSAIAIGHDGALAVSDSLNFRVQLLSRDGEPVSSFGKKGDAPGDLSLPKGVAIDDAGNIWVVDAHFENVQAFDKSGRLLMALGGEGQEAGEFWLPAGIAIDRQHRIWVADSYNRRVQVFQILSPSEGGDAA